MLSIAPQPFPILIIINYRGCTLPGFILCLLLRQYCIVQVINIKKLADIVMEIKCIKAYKLDALKSVSLSISDQNEVILEEQSVRVDEECYDLTNARKGILHLSLSLSLSFSRSFGCNVFFCLGAPVLLVYIIPFFSEYALVFIF